MSEDNLAEHVHLWTRSIEGPEYANAVYETKEDAAVDFLGVVKEITKYNIDAEELDIYDVLDSLEEGLGMYAGTSSLIVVISRCEGNCRSATWN